TPILVTRSWNERGLGSLQYTWAAYWGGFRASHALRTRELDLKAFDQPVEQEPVDDGERNADDRCRCHERLPVINVTADQLGRHAGADGAARGRAHENRRIDVVAKCQCKCKDDTGGNSRHGERERHAEKDAHPAPTVGERGLFDIAR